MAMSNIKAVFQSDIQKLWEKVTFVLDYPSWRSDLSRIEILNEKQFMEYNKKGYATIFTVTVTKPCRQWEFDMENGNIIGHWKGVFTQKGRYTEIDFTEDVTAKRFFIKPFLKAYLKKQQAQFVLDLKNALL